MLVEPPVVKRISEDSLLRDTKLIAEPWDAAGLYQVGTFPGEGAGRTGMAGTATTSGASGAATRA